MEGFFVFVNIYSYISGMKDPLKDISKQKLTELLTKTDIPQSWPLDKIINKKNSDNSQQNKTNNK
jgi:hypothetical protein